MEILLEFGDRYSQASIYRHFGRLAEALEDYTQAKFEEMPEDYRATLAYADALRVQLKAAPDELLDLFLEQRSRKEN